MTLHEDANASTVAAKGLALCETLTEAAAVRSSAPEGADDQPAGQERYDIGDEIGRGGMGRVTSALDRQFARQVAVKHLLHISDPVHRERFEAECLITGNLEHPGVPAVYERGSLGKTPFCAMRLVRGQTLKQAISQAESLSDRLALVQPLIRVAQTLAYAHSQGVIHRDVKPSNIVLGRYGETFLLDWGIAKVRGVPTPDGTGTGSISASSDASRTAAGSVIGTPSYMAPEQASGASNEVDERTDVFALGAILYHVLSGHAPYRGATVDKALDQAKKRACEPIETAAPRAPRALRQICERAMAASPSDRYSSASEMSSALEQFTSEAVAHQDSGPIGWIARGVTVFMAVMAVAVVGVLAVSMPSLREQGYASYFGLAIAALGLTLCGLEYRTRGRYRLGPLIIALTVVTFLNGVVGTGTGFYQVLTYAISNDLVSSPDGYRELLTEGTREAIGSIILGSVLAAAQIFAWALARRRALLS